MRISLRLFTGEEKKKRLKVKELGQRIYLLGEKKGKRRIIATSNKKANHINIYTLLFQCTEYKTFVGG